MSNRTDNCNRTNSTTVPGPPSDGGSDYTVYSGTWGVNGNAIYQPGGTAQAVIGLESGMSDVVVRATFNGTLVDAGLVIRISDDSNYILAVVKPTMVVIYRKQAGGFNALATVSATIAVGDIMSFIGNGSAISLQQNGVLIPGATATETFQQTATIHGMRSNTDTTVRLDDFSITAAGAPANKLGLGISIGL